MAQINIRIDEDVKRSAELLFSRLGMNMSTAISIFIHRALDCNGLPFQVQINDPFYSPRNQQRLEQIKADFDNGMRNYHSHELIEERTHGKALA